MSFTAAVENAKKRGFEYRETTVSGERVYTSYSANDQGGILSFLLIADDKAEPIAVYTGTRDGAAQMLEDFQGMEEAGLHAVA